MATRAVDFNTAQQELLEVYGFDLMAQVEALLRHVREYQREVQRLRRVARIPSGDRSHIKAVTAQVGQLRRVCASLGQTLDLVAHVEQVSPAQPSPPPQANAEPR
jgi:hypothetical protein